jgi:FkbM family methyltransferase
MKLNPKIIENWAMIPGDTSLHRALKKEKKRTKREDITILDYQKDLLLSAINLCKQRRVAIDAGANYGIMSYNLSQLFTDVHSFEIFEPVRNCLIENKKKFNLKNVKIYAYGLGEKNKSVSLDLSRGTLGTYILPNQNGDNLIVPLDSLQIKSVDFIKIDCEGYEPFIIEGAAKTIKTFRPVILMERKGHTIRYNLDKTYPVKILEKWGYIEKISYYKDCIMESIN